MTRDQNTDGVTANGGANGSDSARFANGCRQFTISACGPKWDAQERLPNSLLESRAAAEVKGQALEPLACGLLARQLRLAVITQQSFCLAQCGMARRLWPSADVGVVFLTLKPNTVQAIWTGRQGDLAPRALDLFEASLGMKLHVAIVSDLEFIHLQWRSICFSDGWFFMQVTASIFKAYDIRGTYPQTLNEDLAEGLGKAFGTLALKEGRRTVAVGRDGRLSGPALSSALMRGLVSVGIQVIDVGMTTTPQLYFAAHTLCDSGIQVTGSHNPKDDNGFKMVLGGRAIYGDEIQTLRQLIESESWLPSHAGSVQTADILPAYIQRIVSGIQLSRPLKIVVDSGNGIAGASAPGIFRALGCDVIELFSEVDGHFPHHHPDPSKPENLQDLIATLKSSGAELGLAFDGDGDRLGIVTQDGETIYPDRQMQLFAQDVLSRVPKGTILFDVKCSQRLAPAIRAAGGTPLMYKTGHSLIKAKMKEIEAGGGKAPLGGEMSGHIFFKERWYGFDDGTYAGCRLLEIVSRSADANAVLKGLPTSFSTPELNVACQEGEPHQLTAQLLAVASQHFSAPAEISSIDGLRVDWPDGFGLIRASNTTPVLVLRFEGHTASALDRIEHAMLALLRTVKPDAQLQRSAH